MKALDYWKNVLAALDGGEDVFLSLVADHTRHSPGTRGAKLAITSFGATFGTIGGGAMEKDARARALELLAANKPHASALTLTHRREARGPRSGMICAGQQTNVSFILSHTEAPPIIREVVTRLEEDVCGELVLTSSGGLSIEEVEPDRAQRTVRLIEEESGEWSYREQLLTMDRVVIFGAGHCGLALSNALAVLGWVVTVADIRPELPQLLENESAKHKIIVEDYTQAAASVSHPQITSAIVMTADFPSDTRALDGALRQAFPFIGVMGAPAKLRAIDKALLERGFGSEDLARLVSPVGIPIGSSTPEEIAISVAAQLIQRREELFPSRAPSPFTQAPSRESDA